MRLNLGCGDRYVEGWHNVDLPTTPQRKDEAVDLTKPLPWPPDHLTYVYAGHVLEHLEFGQAAQLVSWLLPCMAPLGEIMIVGPDVAVAEQQASDGTLDTTYHSLESITYGAHRWPGDEHRWRCTAPLVKSILTEAGWDGVCDVGIENVDLTWPVADRTPTWQLAVTAYRVL